MESAWYVEGKGKGKRVRSEHLKGKLEEDQTEDEKGRKGKETED